jgi:phenylacetic acid degradation protein paaN
MTVLTAPDDLLQRHRSTLAGALTAIRDRGYWSAYPESPRAYGEDGEATGRAAFEGYLGRTFPLQQPGAAGTVSTETSPYGIDVGVSYPRVTAATVDALIAAAQAGMPAWRDAGPDVRAAICLEILARLNARSHEIAHAVMHTSGQGYAMAFQAGGPHAQDRGLEAVAYAYAEMTRQPREATWEKPQGKRDPIRMVKRYTVVPRGVALVIGCTTFPTWNSYPGLFASLVTGNAVIVKPHPGAVLPLAITVSVAREVLAEAGFSPDLVLLAAEDTADKLASVLATRPEVGIIDYTGSSAYGNWLEENARQAQVYAEKSGVNVVVVDSTDDYRGMLSNIAFSLSLYSGQMCTTPQNILVPRNGVQADGATVGVDQFGRDLADAVNGLLGDDRRAAALLGGIVNDGVNARIDAAPTLGDVVLESRRIVHPEFPDAVVRTPTIIRVDAASDAHQSECFGPIAFLVTTDDTAASIDLLRSTVREHGAITAAVYSTDDKVLHAAEEAALDSGVALSSNLTQGVYVNQSAAFSDFHATGANPAANAALTDAAFVANRFRVVQSRHHI